jgi:hypothetical protein
MKRFKRTTGLPGTMEFKVLSKEDLVDMERELLADDFTLGTVLNIVDKVKQRYLDQNPVDMVDTPFEMGDYGDDIFTYFRRPLISPSGTTSPVRYLPLLEGCTYRDESFDLNLDELLFLREELFGEVVSTSLSPITEWREKADDKIFGNLDIITSDESLEHKISSKHLYRMLKSVKYWELFDQIDNYDWKSRRITHRKAEDVNSLEVGAFATLVGSLSMTARLRQENPFEINVSHEELKQHGARFASLHYSSSPDYLHVNVCGKFINPAGEVRKYEIF